MLGYPTWESAFNYELSFISVFLFADFLLSTTEQKMMFSIRISSVTLTEETLNGKLDFFFINFFKTYPSIRASFLLAIMEIIERNGSNLVLLSIYVTLGYSINIEQYLLFLHCAKYAKTQGFYWPVCSCILAHFMQFSAIAWMDLSQKYFSKYFSDVLAWKFVAHCTKNEVFH